MFYVVRVRLCCSVCLCFDVDCFCVFVGTILDCVVFIVLFVLYVLLLCIGGPRFFVCGCACLGSRCVFGVVDCLVIVCNVLDFR